MSELSAGMTWVSALQLKLLTTFLLVSFNAVYLHGDCIKGSNHKLHCLTDYLFTINCSLSIRPSNRSSDGNGSYWLTFTETFEKKTFDCMLTNTDEDYFCSLKTVDPMHDKYYQYKTFEDLDEYEIYLYHNQSNRFETCKLLDEDFVPKTNIKPNAPCSLTVSHNSSQHHFTWKSTYEDFRSNIQLMDNLKYQLQYFKRGDGHNVTPHDIYTSGLSFSVDDQHFEPYTKYAARARSSPNQKSYMGEWSEWSSEVHWKTESAVRDPPSNTLLSGLDKVLLPLCVTVPLFFILLCAGPVKKWRQRAFIPTPAPYFHSLYTDCQGDFKSWVVTQDNTSDVLKAEETLHIDTLTKCVDNQEEECQPQFHYQVMRGNTYSNVTDPALSDGAPLGIPYAISTMAPQSDPVSSFKSETPISRPESPAEEDSGCWLCSHTSLEKELLFYCNDYCTLSAFQEICPVTAEHPRSLSTKSCPTGTIRVDDITKA